MQALLEHWDGDKGEQPLIEADEDEDPISKDSEMYELLLHIHADWPTVRAAHTVILTLRRRSLPHSS